MRADFAGGLFDLARALRFSLVGLAATLAYLVIVNLVARPVGPLSPFAAHLAGLSGSIALSYCGHHAFTFRRRGRHDFFFSRFAAITALLFLLSSLFAFACDRYLGLSAAVISVVVAALYPVPSYLVHSLWTFEELSQ